MEGLEHKSVTVSRSFAYSYYCTKSAGSSSKPTILLIHGFPDDAHLYERVIPQLVHLGHPILVPDCLGYGGASKPSDAAAYNNKSMADDMVDILDAEDIKSVIVIRHDWSSFVAQRLYLYHPERVVGLGVLNVAYATPKDDPFDLDAVLALTEKYYGFPSYAYWKLFTAPEGAKLIGDHLESFYCVLHGSEDDWMEQMFCRRDAMKDFLLADRRVPHRGH